MTPLEISLILIALSALILLAGAWFDILRLRMERDHYRRLSRHLQDEMQRLIVERNRLESARDDDDGEGWKR